MSKRIPATSLLGPPPSIRRSIYVENIPPSWSPADVLKAFRPIEPIIDVYIPNKPNRRGLRYGFINVAPAANIAALISGINEMSLGQHKVWGALSLRSRRPAPLVKPRSKPSPSPKHSFIPSLRDCRSYAEIAAPQCLIPSSSPSLPPASAPHSSPPHSNSSQPRIRSIHNPLPSHNFPHLSGLPQGCSCRDAGIFQNFTEDVEWLDSCLVARIIQLSSLSSIHEAFAEQGVFSIFICPLGDDQVLLNFDCKALRDSFLRQRQAWLAQWFFDIRPWKHRDSFGSTRFTWLRLHGVPLELWSEEFFRWISASFGAFVSVEDATLHRARLDVAKVLISTASTKVINSALKFQYNGHSFTVFAGEEACSSLPAGRDYRLPEPVLCSPEVVDSPLPFAPLDGRRSRPSSSSCRAVNSPVSSTADTMSSASTSDPPSLASSQFSLSANSAGPASRRFSSPRSPPEDQLAVDPRFCRSEFTSDGIDVSPINLGSLEFFPLRVAASSSTSPLSSANRSSLSAGLGSSIGPLLDGLSPGLFSLDGPNHPSPPRLEPSPSPLIRLAAPSSSQPSPSSKVLPVASLPCLPPFRSRPRRSRSGSRSRSCSNSSSVASHRLSRRMLVGSHLGSSLPLSQPSLRRKGPVVSSASPPRLPRRVRAVGGVRRCSRPAPASLSTPVVDPVVSSLAVPLQPVQPSDSDIVRMNNRHRLSVVSSPLASASSEALATAEVGAQLGFTFSGERDSVLAALSDLVVEETRLWDEDHS